MDYTNHIDTSSDVLCNTKFNTKDIYNYSLPANELKALDEITALPMYETTNGAPDTNYAINDLVKFRIAVINNEGGGKKSVYIHFRAFIDSFTDNYNASWNDLKYVGRGDSFYNYSGFKRNINMSFTVAVQSKAELIPMYKKLNYLASSLAPDYSENGFMRGNLVRLTVGGYIYEQHGIINSLNYSIPTESPWEIGIDNTDSVSTFDSSVKELPLIIKVSGFSFTPLQNFLPRKAQYDNQSATRYISLAAGGDSNYNDVYTVYPKYEGGGKGEFENVDASQQFGGSSTSLSTQNPGVVES